MDNRAAAKKLPEAQYLRECFDYLSTGHLRWKIRPRRHFRNNWAWNYQNTRYGGKIAGFQEPGWHGKINIDGVRYNLHRIIYQMMIGPLRAGECVDHRDGDPANNKISNLRKCLHAQNIMNQGDRGRKTPKNVFFIKKERKYRVDVKAFGKTHCFGLFTSLEEASKVAKAARDLVQGEFACHRKHHKL